ncbi:hypothetical protein LCGC14_2295270 [marine sediment metagenome]|uniref:Uncharacterized protein n=1 Tax=marine sediment metagenome TaxID=412755 RepID=A0A0F9F2J3_9ZZZZ
MGFFLDAQLVGIKKVDSLTKRIEKDIRQGLPKRLKTAAEIVKTAAQSRAKSRRVRAAMSFDVKVKSATDFEARVGTERRKAFFAHFLEFGTEHSKAAISGPAAKAKEGEVLDVVGRLPSIR